MLKIGDNDVFLAMEDKNGDMWCQGVKLNGKYRFRYVKGRKGVETILTGHEVIDGFHFAHAASQMVGGDMYRTKKEFLFNAAEMWYHLKSKTKMPKKQLVERFGKRNFNETLALLKKDKLYPAKVLGGLLYTYLDWKGDEYVNSITLIDSASGADLMKELGVEDPGKMEVSERYQKYYGAKTPDEIRAIFESTGVIQAKVEYDETLDD